VSEQDPAPVLNSAVFSTSQDYPARARAKAVVAVMGRKPASDALVRRRVVVPCTESCHMLVNELHSVDFKPDKAATFLLTPKTGRVKTQSFFDNF
jgi:hypothetical protein